MNSDVQIRAAQRNFMLFSSAVFPQLHFAAFHINYYRILQAFADGRIKRLIVTMPPQHGKSLGSTLLLPSFLLGRNPNLRIAIASYSDTFAKLFGKKAQRIICGAPYKVIFPDTALDSGKGEYLRTASEAEIVGYKGSLKAVGRGGGLTGNPVDIMIMDDLYKDSAEGNSPTIRDAAWEWYTSVARTRLHNNSQELIVFTRWHEDDLIGRIEQTERVITLTSLDDINNLPQGQGIWAKVNFEAIKESAPTEIDPRPEGEPLWEERHSIESLTAKRRLDTHNFECLYQGKPASREGLLYSAFNTYNELPPPAEIIKRTAYVDTADTGEDYLCAISYVVAKDGYCYITDILYTQEPMEVTEQATANLLTRNDCRSASIESNNGGRGFARNVQRLAPRVKVEWFHQSGNKESRILSNSATVQHNILMPSDWSLRFPLFYAHLTAYKRLFRANTHDDCADAITGIAEREYQTKKRVTMIV